MPPKLKIFNPKTQTPNPGSKFLYPKSNSVSPIHPNLETLWVKLVCPETHSNPGFGRHVCWREILDMLWSIMEHIDGLNHIHEMTLFMDRRKYFD